MGCEKVRIGMEEGSFSPSPPPNPQPPQVVGTRLLACGFPYQKLPRVLINSPVQVSQSP